MNKLQLTFKIYELFKKHNYKVRCPEKEGSLTAEHGKINLVVDINITEKDQDGVLLNNLVLSYMKDDGLIVREQEFDYNDVHPILDMIDEELSNIELDLIDFIPKKMVSRFKEMGIDATLDYSEAGSFVNVVVSGSNIRMVVDTNTRKIHVSIASILYNKERKIILDTSRYNGSIVVDDLINLFTVLNKYS